MVFSKTAVLLVAAVGLAEAAVVSRISPELEPKSDEKFFGKNGDYPSDKRPSAAKLAFDHPYPAVQDSGDFSTDYVKDENGDNGQWKAQMEYDTLRAKLRKEHKQAEKALAKKNEEMKELEDAMAGEKHAEENAHQAKDKSARAKEAADKAAKDVEEMGKYSGKGGGKDFKDGKSVSESKLDKMTAEVNKEMSDLEKCKKELEEAKARLKKVMEEKEALEKKEASDADAAEKAHAEELAAAKALAAAEGKEAQDAKAKEAKLEGEEKDLQKEVAEEKEEHAEAQAKYDKQKLEVEKTKADLAKAEERLRGLRGDSPADHGHSKSFAARPFAAITAVFVAVAGLFMH